jgi:hypothetical protein
MKKKYFLFLIIFFCSKCFAQLTSDKTPSQFEIDKAKICGGMEEVLKIKGKWKERKDGNHVIFSDKTFPVNQYNQVFSRIDKVLPMIKEAIPNLGGFEPVWQRIIQGDADVVNGSVPYRFSCYNYEYYCNNNLNKIMLAEETTSKVEICFNDHGLLGDKMADWDINGNGKMVSVYQLPEMLGKWKGQNVYQPKLSSKITDRAVVLGHNGKMPWFILTKKQYLTGYKNYLAKTRKMQLEGFDDYVKKFKENIANMKASMSLTAEQRKSVVDKLDQQLANYQTNTLQKNITEAEKIYKDQIKPVNEYLDTANEATLNKQAVLDTKSNISFKGAFAGEGQIGIKLMSFDPNYFNTSLPRYVPQYIVLYWRWGKSKSPSDMHVAMQLEENFHIQKLQVLMDK